MYEFPHIEQKKIRLFPPLLENLYANPTNSSSKWCPAPSPDEVEDRGGQVMHHQDVCSPYLKLCLSSVFDSLGMRALWELIAVGGIASSWLAQ
jgi:hypothetical protein